MGQGKSIPVIRTGESIYNSIILFAVILIRLPFKK